MTMMHEGDHRQEEIIKARFEEAVVALRPFLSEQCGLPASTRIVLDEDLSADFIDCGDDEDYQMFGYGTSRLTIDGERVCVVFGTTPYHPQSWMFDYEKPIDTADFQISVLKCVLGGTVTRAIVTIEQV